MLKSLSIKNFTLIEEININFSEGFNILIGETGAGKSIIISALSLALGGRALTEQVKQGKDKAIIEAIFQIANFHPVFNLLESLSIEFNDNIIVSRREISVKGNSRCFINDSLVQVAQLKQLGELIADFHGQHDNQIILKPENHVKFIDALIKDSDIFNDYSGEYNNQKELISTFNNLTKQEKELKYQSEAFSFELSEIQKISPKTDELDELDKEIKILENSEILVELLLTLRSNLTEKEISVSNLLFESIKALKKLSSIDESFGTYADELVSVSVSVQEISRAAESYLNGIEFNPERIENIRYRLSALNGLKKKYGSYGEIFDRINYLEEKLSLSQNFDKKLEMLKNDILLSKNKLGQTAKKLSDQRREKADIFVSLLLQKLNDLSLENSKFVVEFAHHKLSKEQLFDSVSCIFNDENISCSPEGIDNIQFLISTNMGENPKLLSNVASGGELSRIMLAIKSITAEKNSIHTLIFDEIDTGISGKIAQRVGAAMKELSSNHQIIAITHLAQIAAMGDKVISIKKHENNKQAIISSNEEDNESKITEIAKLISGESITTSSLKTVTELFNQQAKI